MVTIINTDDEVVQVIWFIHYWGLCVLLNI